MISLPECLAWEMGPGALAKIAQDSRTQPPDRETVRCEDSTTCNNSVVKHIARSSTSPAQTVSKGSKLKSFDVFWDFRRNLSGKSAQVLSNQNTLVSFCIGQRKSVADQYLIRFEKTADEDYVA